MFCFLIQGCDLVGNKYLYEPTSWQGFVQQLQFLISRSGYRYFSVTYYPEHKKDKWEKIDQRAVGALFYLHPFLCKN